MSEPSLVERMRVHPRAAEMAAEADALESASEGYWAAEQHTGPKQFLGCWARARRKWCDITGEPLV